MLHFHDLQEALRKRLREHIDSGELTGTELAEKTNFEPAHISNFLNRKRGLSLSGIDRVMQAEDLSVLDLISSEEIHHHAGILAPPEDDYANLPLVEPRHAASPQMRARDVIEVIKFRHSFLRGLRSDMVGYRGDWLRFLLMKPLHACCQAMSPRLTPGCTVLLDRHYNSLTPYRQGETGVYAIRSGGEAMVRKAHLEGNTIVLGTESPTIQSRLVHLPPDADPTALIIGRVAFIMMET